VSVRRGFIYWRCRCDCDNEIDVRAAHLLDGKILSCKCLQRESRHTTPRTHGLSNDPLYNLWGQIKSRCSNSPANAKHRYYGARGITVCQEWIRDPKAFIEYARTLGPRPSLKHSIDRIQNHLGYEPGNLRWATQYQQVHNSRTIKFRKAEQLNLF
jgi:hypothetical protein